MANQAVDAIPFAVATFVAKPRWICHPDPYREGDWYPQFDETEIEKFIEGLRIVIDPKEYLDK